MPQPGNIFVIRSLRGGLNNTDPAITLPDDQCIQANNVEFIKSALGERRQGTIAISLPANILSKDRVPFMFRHLPSVDETASTLFVLGVTGTSGYQLVYKDTAWHDITISDTVDLSGFNQYRWQAVSLHGKAFFAFNSNVDRLHVYDTLGNFRRVGVKTPAAAPTAADDAGAGTFSGVRYYRVRFIEKSGATVLRRSEPSAVLTFTPNSAKAGVTVTKPATVSEGETHWELEASLDNANFYVIATTVVGTTTFDDTNALVPGYAGLFLLSEDIGSYDLIGSARYLSADSDRLIWAGSWEDDSLGSRVGWTPVSNAAGVGNDERSDANFDPTLDLDGYEGGSITGLSQTSGGSFFVFKLNHIYKLVRTGEATASYDVVTISKDRGALHGSVISGVDQLGRPAIYFLDTSVGPCRYGSNGIEWCGSDIRDTWITVNRDANKVICSGLYDPISRQVQWNVALNSSNTPNLTLVVQTDAMKSDDTGTHRGWATWDGNRAKALCACLYSDNIDANAARSRTLRPFIGLEGLGLVHRCDVGNTDNSIPYTATIVTKPYLLSSILAASGAMVGALLAKAITGATLSLRLIRDFGLEITPINSISTTPSILNETDVIKKLDNLVMSEAKVLQVEFVDDNAGGTTRWQLNQFAMKSRGEQTS